MPRGKSEVSVNVSPVAAGYTNERVIEFSSPVGGGLIGFTLTQDDQLAVHVYRQDMTVQVTAGEIGEPVRHGNLRADHALYLAAKAYVTDYESRHSQEGILAPGEAEFISRTGETFASYAAKHMYDPPQG